MRIEDRVEGCSGGRGEKVEKKELLTAVDGSASVNQHQGRLIVDGANNIEAIRWDVKWRCDSIDCIAVGMASGGCPSWSRPSKPG